MSVVFAKIQMRRGTAAQWAAANPVLAQGELAFETDTGLTKIGDGATAYSSLPAYATYDQMLAAKEALDEAALDVAAVEASRTAAAASAATASTKATEAAASAAAALASEQSIVAKVNQAEQARIDAIAYAAVAEEKADEIVASANAAAADASAADADRIAAEAARTGAEAAQAIAQGAAAGALASEVAADASADVASGAAASALSIYGSVDAQNTAVAVAQAQASLAAGHAASAASVVQQDLSGVTAQALHRSPNAITSMFIYDTSKDSDGGAWTEKCQHTSWWNEAINGKWLGAQASELEARLAAPTLGSELVSNGDFSSGATTGWSASGSAALSVVSGRLRVANGAAVTGGATFVINTVAGRTYQWTYFVDPATSGGVSVRARDNTSLTVLQTATRTIAGTHTVTFVAQGSTTQIQGVNGFSTVGAYHEFDNVSVREVTALTTVSGDYYQSSADGRFYRLWKNLLSRSEEFDNAAWVKGSATITANSGVSPDGSFTADTFIPNSGQASATAGQSVTVSQTQHVVSFYAKAAGQTSISIVSNLTGTFRANVFNLATETATPGTGWTGSITAVGNGWYRCSCTATADAAGSKTFQISNNSAGWTGAGTSGVLIWGAQLELGSTATAYERKIADSTVSEVFRGNKRDFPRLAGIVAEATSVTIYDLTEPGRPMWLRWTPASSPLAGLDWWRAGARNATSLCAANGMVFFGVNSGSSVDGSNGVCFANLVSDAVGRYGISVATGGYGLNAASGSKAVDLPSRLSFGIVNGLVNAVAVTVLPDAPVDPVTGLRVPTIAVATAGGTSVIKHNGTVVNSSLTFAHQSVDIKGTTLFVGDATRFPYFASNIGGLGPSFVLSSYGNYGQAGGWQITLAKLVAAARNQQYGYFGRAAYGGKTNEAASIRGLGFRIDSTFNTGWMTGDIRRCFLSDTGIGSLTAGVSLFSDLFTPDRVLTSGTSWRPIIATASVTGGVLEIRHDHVNSPTGRVVSAADLVEPGKTYRCRWTVESLVGNATGSVVGLGQDNSGNGGVSSGPLTGVGSFEAVIQVPLTATGRRITMFANGGTATGAVAGVRVSAFTVEEIVSDRSFRGAGALVAGTLTRAQLASGTSLVGYSGFSAANYLREPYSADLDFGTGEWTASAWLNVAQARMNLLTFTEQFDNGEWAKGGVTVSANTALAPDGASTAEKMVEDTSTGVHRVLNAAGVTVTSGATYTWSVFAKAAERTVVRVTNNNLAGATFDLSNNAAASNVSAGITAAAVAVGNGWFRLSVTAVAVTSTERLVAQTVVGGDTSYTGDGTSGVLIWGAQLETGSTATTYQRVVTGSEIVNPIFDRTASSGPRIRLAMNGNGNLVAEAFDGTTTRTVTTSAAYNTGQWIKARVSYTTDGTLAILVNGREVAATRGAPLLTLNNASAVLTIGNSFALDAPFPGSIALLKLGATVPTPEQATFMFEQEKQLFRAGALSVLPDSGAIVDMAYDDATDRWVAVSATNESYWTGLVRNSVQAVPAGSFSRVVAGSGLELAARTGTNPGVDVTIPAYGLREELVRRAEAAARLSRELVAFDFVGGFTANTTNGSAAVANVAGLTYPGSLIGARVSGAGIPANTRIVGVSGTTIYLSAVCTATATGVAVSFLDFNLPVAFEARAVLSAGALRREGSTADFTRLYDGFLETIRFAVAPGATAWVQIQATRGTMQ